METKYTPIHAIKAAILKTLAGWDSVTSARPDLKLLATAVETASADEIEAAYWVVESELPDALQDATAEVRCSGTETNLESPTGSRHFDYKEVAILTPNGRWVGFTFWSGGGKHASPEEVEWMGFAYWVDAKPGHVISIRNEYSRVEDMPDVFEGDSIGDIHTRLACMNTFCAPVSTESMNGQTVYSWINTESQKLIAAMGEDAAAGVGPMSAFQRAFGTGPVSGIVAHLFAIEFTNTPAKNYIELVYNAPTMGDFTVTIQKHDHKTPGQRIAELEASLAIAEKNVAMLTRIGELESKDNG